MKPRPVGVDMAEIRRFPDLAGHESAFAAAAP